MKPRGSPAPTCRSTAATTWAGRQHDCCTTQCASGAAIDCDQAIADTTRETQLTSSANATCTVRREASRSEEHTSELQSLMRISSAVFCLKKKKQIYIQAQPVLQDNKQT